MPFFVTTFLSILSLSSIVSSQQDSSKNFQGCVPTDEFDPSFDYFPEKYVPREQFYEGPPAVFFPNKFVPHNSTDYFTISYHNSYKIVTNKYHDKSYLLYQCGTPLPDEEAGKHHLVLPIPHTGGIAITETPQIPPLELLDQRRAIIAYIGNPEFVSSPCMQYMMETEGSIDVFFDPNDPYNSTITAAFKQDFLQEHPDAIILEGPFGDKDGGRAVSIASSNERTNVATFDWIGLYAALFNLEGEASRITREALARYECSSANAAFLSADKPADKRPTVLWAVYFEGSGWSLANCPSWQETYYCEYAKHCGANIITRPEGVGNTMDGLYWYVNDTELLELGKDADVWIFPSPSWDLLYAEKNDILNQFKAVQDKKVYDTQGQGSNAWFEQRLAEYDVVALDFCEVVGNSNPALPLHVRRWFRNVYTEPVGAFDACKVPDEIDEPHIPVSAECTRLDGVTADTSSEDPGSSGSSAAFGLSRGTMVAALGVALSLAMDVL